jgi:hypothetical protein
MVGTTATKLGRLDGFCNALGIVDCSQISQSAQIPKKAFLKQLIFKWMVDGRDRTGDPLLAKASRGIKSKSLFRMRLTRLNHQNFTPLVVPKMLQRIDTIELDG